MDTNIATGAREDVLTFYEKLPFNVTERPENAASLVKKLNNVEYIYPNVDDLYYADSVLEMGCGAGWLSNSIAYYYGVSVEAIDFNPVAIDAAKQTSEILGTNVHFECADLFKYKCAPKDIVISVGVLHHTSDVKAGICRCIELTKDNGKIFIGLYHKYGRKPFLDYFAQLRKENRDEDFLFSKYQELDQRKGDNVQTKSWFLDQVLHPYETQHTLKEVAEIFGGNGVSVVSTSINDYEHINNLEELYQKEKTLYEVGKNIWMKRNITRVFFMC